MQRGRHSAQQADREARLSYSLGYDLDLLAVVPDVARAAGIGEAEAGYGLLRADHFCWRNRTTLNPPASFPARLLAAFFGAGIDVGQLAELLTAFGILKPVQGTELVTYLPAAEYSRVALARAEGGRSASANLTRGSSPPGATERASNVTPIAARPPSVRRSEGSPPLSREGAGREPGGSRETSPAQGSPSLPAISDQRSATTNSKVGGDHDATRASARTPSPAEFWGSVTALRRAAKLSATPKPEGLAAWLARSVELVPYAWILAGYGDFLRDRHWRPKGAPWAAWLKQWQGYAREPDGPSGTACHVCSSAIVLGVDAAAEWWGLPLCGVHHAQAFAGPAQSDAYAARTWLAQVTA
jgi:hypothetical protein